MGWAGLWKFKEPESSHKPSTSGWVPGDWRGSGGRAPPPKLFGFGHFKNQTKPISVSNFTFNLGDSCKICTCLLPSVYSVSCTLIYGCRGESFKIRKLKNRYKFHSYFTLNYNNILQVLFTMLCLGLKTWQLLFHRIAQSAKFLYFCTQNNSHLPFKSSGPPSYRLFLSLIPSFLEPKKNPPDLPTPTRVFMNTPLPRTTCDHTSYNLTRYDSVSYDRTIYALTLPRKTYDRKAICFDFTEDDLRPYSWHPYCTVGHHYELYAVWLYRGRPIGVMSVF